MAGLISTGEDYKNKAVQGFVRESADMQRINEANQEMEEATKQQHIRNTTQGISAAISTAVLIAALL
jgi:hypothetical protein